MSWGPFWLDLPPSTLRDICQNYENEQWCHGRSPSSWETLEHLFKQRTNSHLPNQGKHYRSLKSKSVDLKIEKLGNCASDLQKKNCRVFLGAEFGLLSVKNSTFGLLTTSTTAKVTTTVAVRLQGVGPEGSRNVEFGSDRYPMLSRCGQKTKHWHRHINETVKTGPWAMFGRCLYDSVIRMVHVPYCLLAFLKFVACC